MIPTRSEYSGQSYKLFTDYNDVHVFVEDAGFENLYTEVFKCSGLKIRKAFSKNGKDSVIEAARGCNDRKCVYVIDRDWDDFLQKIQTLRNLVILEKHSIENYLLSYSGFRSVVIADNPKDDINSVLSKNMFDTIVDYVSQRLRPLFECYLTMQMTKDPRSNCSRRPGAFQARNRTCAPDEKAIATFIDDIGLPIPEVVRDYFSGDVLKDRGHGKYMLHFVWAGVRQKSGTKQVGFDTLMIRLAQTTDARKFRNLCNDVSRRAMIGS